MMLYSICFSKNY